MEENFIIKTSLECYKKELNNLIINGSDVYEYSEIITLISKVNELIKRYTSEED